MLQARQITIVNRGITVSQAGVRRTMTTTNGRNRPVSRRWPSTGRIAYISAAVVAASVGMYAMHTYGDISATALQKVFGRSLIRADARPTNTEPMPTSILNEAIKSTAGQVEFPRAAGYHTKTSAKTLSEEEVSARVREHEESYIVDRNQGVVRFDITQLASNPQIEDDYTAKVVSMPFADGDSDWYFFGVFDGHGGWNTSAKLRESLVPYVAREMMEAIQTKNKSKEFGIETPANGRLIDRAIEMGFMKLDDDIVKQPFKFLVENPYKPASPELLMPAMSGSCALLSVYDAATSTLRVACTGDSRAVWAHKDEGGTWTATPLSYDQCGRNLSEQKRLRDDHPKEKDSVIRNGRVLGGLEPTRAFGDARYKLPAEILEYASKAFFGRVAPRDSLTPPYVTARPEILTTKVEPGDFLVLATDGIWDELTTKDVVQLVLEWAKKSEVETGKPPTGIETSVRKGGIFSKMTDLADIPVKADVEELNARVEQREVVDASALGLKNLVAVQKHFRGLFTVEDNNAATHIVRNALGGVDKEKRQMLLSLPPPMSRRYRDDMTAIVVFFGKPNSEHISTGRITINKNATAAR
ncbi:phosphatase 2C-like domain-containing protein [Dipodascopsis uninucleata]